eukprot:gene9725-1928_t
MTQMHSIRIPESAAAFLRPVASSHMAPLVMLLFIINETGTVMLLHSAGMQNRMARDENHGFIFHSSGSSSLQKAGIPQIRICIKTDQQMSAQQNVPTKINKDQLDSIDAVRQNRLETLSRRLEELKQLYHQVKTTSDYSENDLTSQTSPLQRQSQKKTKRIGLAPKDINTLHLETIQKFRSRLQSTEISSEFAQFGQMHDTGESFHTSQEESLLELPARRRYTSQESAVRWAEVASRPIQHKNSLSHVSAAVTESSGKSRTISKRAHENQSPCSSVSSREDVSDQDLPRKISAQVSTFSKQTPTIVSSVKNTELLPQQINKSTSSDINLSDNKEASIYHCPWPNCNKTFRRIKSRSAHLKWHGGDYDSSLRPEVQRNSVSSSSRTTGINSSGRPLSVGSGTTMSRIKSAVALSVTSTFDSGKSQGATTDSNTVLAQEMHPGDVFTLNDCCDMIQLIGKRCSFLKHAQEDGVHVAVMHLLQPGAVVLLHVKDLAVLTRCTLYDSNNNTASTSSPTVSQPTSPALCNGENILIKRVAEDGSEFYERFEIISNSSEVFGRSLESGEEIEFSKIDEIIPDKSVSHDELTLGMRVLSSVDEREHVLWPGHVHRIEPTRARVNFDSKPLRWKKEYGLGEEQLIYSYKC